LLLLDYDGTLAPFRDNPLEAVPDPFAYAALQRIAREGSTSAGIVTGRSILEIRVLIPDFAGFIVGEHGWEAAAAGGDVEQHPISPELAEQLDWFASAVEQRIPGARLQRKRTSVAIHLRGLPSDQQARVREAVIRLVEEDDALRRVLQPAPWKVAALRLRPIQEGVELRATGRDKGTAVRECVAEAGEGAFAVYAGDDETDEDAFLAVRSHGAGILVAAEERPTHAGVRMKSIEGITSFLEAWWNRIIMRASQEDPR
jgi:trehalose-phosphatase